jgi:hypothetical protein
MAKREQLEFWVDAEEGGYWVESCLTSLHAFIVAWLKGYITAPYRVRVGKGWVVLPVSDGKGFPELQG